MKEIINRKILSLGYPKKYDILFVSQMPFVSSDGREMEVILYNSFEHALKWKLKKEAKAALSMFPGWAKKRHKIVKIGNFSTGYNYAIKMRRKVL